MASVQTILVEELGIELVGNKTDIYTILGIYKDYDSKIEPDSVRQAWSVFRLLEPYAKPSACSPSFFSTFLQNS